MKLIQIVIALFLFIFIGLFMYGISDYGRLIRDHGVYASGISDSDVKSLWCGFNDLPQDWYKKNGQQYCGDIPVEMKCILSNYGDHCQVEVLDLDKDVSEVEDG